MISITNILVAVIYVSKLTFIILGIILLHLKHAGPKYKIFKNTIHHLKNISEFVGLLLFSILLLDLFNPLKKGIYISGEIQYMLFLSGIIIFITLNWRKFFDESRLLRQAQHLV
jgi:hypothetical protein